MIKVGKNYSMPSGRQITVVAVEETVVTYEVIGYKTPKPLRKHIDEFLVMNK